MWDEPTIARYVADPYLVLPRGLRDPITNGFVACPDVVHRAKAEEYLRIMAEEGLSQTKCKAKLSIDDKAERKWELIFPDWWPRAFALAKKSLAQREFDKTIDGQDDLVPRLMELKGEQVKIATALVQAERLRAETTKWRASKLDQDQFGDHLKIGGTIKHEAVVLLPPLAPLPQALPAPTVTMLPLVEDAEAVIEG